MHSVTDSKYEVRVFMGSRERYDGPWFTEEEVVKAIQDYGLSLPNEQVPPVRVTKTRFVRRDYEEAGFEIAVINYPRYRINFNELDFFISGLAAHLLNKFKQNRMSIQFEDRVTVIEDDDAIDPSFRS